MLRSYHEVDTTGADVIIIEQFSVSALTVVYFYLQWLLEVWTRIVARLLIIFSRSSTVLISQLKTAFSLNKRSEKKTEFVQMFFESTL